MLAAIGFAGFCIYNYRQPERKADLCKPLCHKGLQPFSLKPASLLGFGRLPAMKSMNFAAALFSTDHPTTSISVRKAMN